jgi:hypothetical protein
MRKYAAKFFLLPASAIALAMLSQACGGADGSVEQEPTEGQGGNSAGSAGKASAGTAGAGAAGKGGTAGQAGAGGAAAGGAAGKAQGGAGQSQGGAGQAQGGAGQAQGGAGSGGIAGQTAGGQSGQGGAAGQQPAGASGAGQGGAGKAQGGAGQSQGGAGTSQGGAGTSQGGAGQSQGGAGQSQGGAGSSQGGAGLGGDAGTSGAGQSLGGAGSGQGGAGSGQGGAGAAQGGAGTGGQSSCQAAQPCYEGPANTTNVGQCKPGQTACQGDVVSCQGQVLPTIEECNGKDDNCDGQIDEGFGTQICGVGECQVMSLTCANGSPVQCTPKLPQPEVCDGKDNNCDGTVDEGCDCLNGDSRACYDGPAGTENVGACKGGSQLCVQGKWEACQGEVVPGAEVCDGKDNDCNGQVDENQTTLNCGVGACSNSTPSCVKGQPQQCVPLAPQAEKCNGKDDNCDGQIDEGTTCCAPENICGNLCCPGGQACSFQKCVVPGNVCLGSEDCAAGSYCEYALGDKNQPPMQCQGATQKTGKCLPRPPVCAVGVDPGDPPTCLTKCEYKPPPSAFEPVVKYTWGGQTTSPYSSDVMMTPLVIELDDDDCDGKVTERDIPEIVFTTFASGKYQENGTLHAISADRKTGKLVDKWSLPGVIWSSSELAAGNIDGVAGNEIVGVTKEGTAANPLYYLQAIKADGTKLWKTTDTVSGRFPSIADLDGDGQPEIIMSGKIFNGKTGALKTTLTLGNSIVSDIDGDGKPDIVGPVVAYKADGTLLANTGLAGATNAIGDLDGDGKPEIVSVSSSGHVMHIWRYNPAAPGKYTIIRQNIDINGTLDPNLCPVGSAGRTSGGGVPTIADFNGDGVPDVALAGGVGYAVFDGKKLMNGAIANKDTFLWIKQTQDCSSAVTGSSLFDFNGDGKAEVLYGDEIKFRIYEGATGNVLFETCNTTGTLYEYPVVADIDNDGQADILVVSNAYAETCNGTKQSGIRIFGSKNNDWVRTRRVWNQHSYHITNVNEDGSIPKNELPNWTQPGLNNFRLNKQPAGEFLAADLVVSVSPTCVDPYALVARVRNIGEVAVDAGVKVGFYAGNTKLGEAFTTTSLYPAESEDVSLPLAIKPSVNVTAVVDDGMPAHPWHECRTDNNVSAPSNPVCQF